MASYWALGLRVCFYFMIFHYVSDSMLHLCGSFGFLAGVPSFLDFPSLML